MTWASFGAFAVAMTALCVVPGPAVMLVLSQALGHGAARAVWSILGITAAGIVWCAMSASRQNASRRRCSSSSSRAKSGRVQAISSSA